MICEPCRRASSFLDEEEVIYQYLDGRPQVIMPGPMVAKAIHGECRETARQAPGGGLTAVERAGSAWCDCQHVVPVRSGGQPLTLDK